MQFIQKQINGKYLVGPKIGGGSFGEIYTIYSQGKIYALKKEDDNTKHPQIFIEAKIMEKMSNTIGFPCLQWYGNESHCPNLQDLLHLCGGRFQLKTGLLLADQMISRIESLHANNFLHRDIKPQNFVMGVNNNSHLVYLIDFGLSCRYRDHKTHQHIPYKENKALTGTARYSSINVHLGIQQSRRDDLESIGYLLIYILKGQLPWQGIKAYNKVDKYQKIMQKKMSIPIEILCRQLPIEFCIFMNYCRSLKFQQNPDYLFLRKLFQQLSEKIKFNYDFKYDWTNLNSFRSFNHNQFISIEIQNEQNFKKLIALTKQKLQNRIMFQEENNSDIEDQFQKGQENVINQQIFDGQESLNKLSPFLNKKNLRFEINQ